MIVAYNYLHLFTVEFIWILLSFFPQNGSETFWFLKPGLFFVKEIITMQLRGLFWSIVIFLFH